ncbi:MAG TPA: undecaprenyldiphospho-muramoylpentapeptide beta-N-acetylglucosaminyltransferase [Candidatus Moranbacteria bacterium]|nr:undecaprenyldiphospho-muramoylpentapeptide beta-N-acetylglucosaminyltransferase [Candidatus Moranbacteria bacterium]HRZ33752.1 undecaprenyldiphospho-muramoylpentapeptide beta-N-acetylglucosaminyltransferase [Candidatus Moranbacteria bacterium]
MRVLLTGGGTGGHLTPLIAVIDELRKKIGPDLEILYVGSGAQMEKEIMSEKNIPAKFVLSGKMRRYFSLKNILDFFKLPIGFFQSLWILLWFTPDVIFSKGGYVAVPIVIAAWIYRIPIMIHESDSIPGIANQFLSKFADRIAVAYPSAEEYFPKEKTALIGNPIRFEVTEGDPLILRKKLGFTESKKTILVLGGSQGSQTINNFIIKILPKILPYYQVIHQTGQEHFNEVIEEAAYLGIKSGREGYYAVPFMNANQLRDAFAASDLIISRAGATSITEIAANAKPAILVPITHSANDHQRMNAYALAGIGAALVLEEANLGEHILIEKIDTIMNDENLKRKMIERLKTFYHPNATEVIANSIIEVANS